MNATIDKLLECVRRKSWHDATEVFQSIMQTKVALRLAEERKRLAEADEDEVSSDCCGSTISNGRCDECNKPCEPVKRGK